MQTVTLTETGCYLDNHRGHYIQRDVVYLAVEHGFIIGGFEKFVIDLYDEHSHQEYYPHEELTELCDAAIEWLNSGQSECPHCDGTGGLPSDESDWWVDQQGNSRCKPCTGTGRAPRIEFQNFPPIIPEDYMWGFNDGDFGLYHEDNEEVVHAD